MKVAMENPLCGETKKKSQRPKPPEFELKGCFDCTRCRVQYICNRRLKSGALFRTRFRVDDFTPRNIPEDVPIV